MPTTLVLKNAARDVGGEDGRGLSGGVRSGEHVFGVCNRCSAWQL